MRTSMDARTYRRGPALLGIVVAMKKRQPQKHNSGGSMQVLTAHGFIMASYTNEFPLHLSNSLSQAEFLLSDHGPRHANAIVLLALARVLFVLLRLLRCHLLGRLRCRAADEEVSQVVARLCAEQDEKAPAEM